MIKSVAEIRQDILKEKEEKYQKMLAYQEEILVEAIRENYGHSRLFVFSDKGRFHGIEGEWYEEFKERATQELEGAGYTVRGICVYW